MRAFIALELPADFADDTAAAARRLSASLEGRFLDRSTYHLTLAFLGDIDDAEASRAMDALDVACAGSAPVSLAPDGLGKFGRPADATLWLGVAPDPALQALAERVREHGGKAGFFCFGTRHKGHHRPDFDVEDEDAMLLAWRVFTGVLARLQKA